MKTFVYIALVTFLGSVPVQAYGPKRHRHNYYGRGHRPPTPDYRSPNDFEHTPYDGPTHGWPHGPHYPPPEFNYFVRPYGYFGPTQPWDDSTEWDSGSSSTENDEYSSENVEKLNDWPDFFHLKLPCLGNCKQPTNKPSNTALPTSVPKTTKTEKSRPTQAKTPEHTTNPFSTTANATPRPTRTVSSTEAPTTSPLPTTTTEEEFTTLTPEVLTCIESCRSTPEFNPVCGTDGETYENEGMLFCAKSCGVNVSLRRRSVCPPPIFSGGDEEPPPTTNTLPTTTTTTLIARTSSLSSLQRCMKQCAITPDIAPVCGTDSVTYINIDRLECARGCGQDVEILCMKPCAACGVTPATTTPKTTPSTLATETSTSITQKPDKTEKPETKEKPEGSTKECLAKCPATMESNPVCGTDQVTYRNPSHLLCAQLCGVSVSIDRFSPCLPTTTFTPPSTSTTSEIPNTTVSLSLLTCLTSCPVTTEYNPVCGTDDLTYNNPGYIECAKFCGIDVELKSKSPCELDFESNDTDTTTLRTTETTNGNKEVVSVTQTTATTTSLFTSPIQTTTPVSTVITTVPVSTTNAPITTTTRFSIPPDVLNYIFGPTTTRPPPSINPDNDEEVDIDIRFNNDTENNGDSSKITFRE